MSNAATALITVADFDRLTAGKKGRYELRHGEMVEMTFPKPRHNRAQRRLLHLLTRLAGEHYVVATELAFRPMPDHELWAADVAVVAELRIAESEECDEYLNGSPEIVIEVLSPSNSADEMDDRRATCLAGGCQEFWVVNPRLRTVRIFDREGVSREYKADQLVPFSLTSQSFPAAGIFS